MSVTLLSTLGDELLDHPDADPDAVAASLRNIARANRWFGGWWAVRRGLQRVAGQVTRGSQLTLLDIGCGMGDLTARAVGWGTRRGLKIVPIGLERHRTAAGLAQETGIATLLGCAGAIPVAEKSVDLIVASQLVHHLTPEAIVRFCQAADRLARRGVIIADLRRSMSAGIGFRIGSRILGFDAVTKADGLTSIRRGFRAEELQALLARAGIAARVEHTLGLRLLATWTPSGA